jgi:hypothetical protein
MTVAFILFAIAVGGLSIWGYHSIVNYFVTNFGNNPIAMHVLCALLVCTLAILFGFDWRMKLIQQHGDVLNGTLTIAAGMAGVIFVFFRNVMFYRMRIGILASLLQLIAMPIFTAMSPLIFLVSLLRNLGVQHVRIIKE